MRSKCCDAKTKVNKKGRLICLACQNECERKNGERAQTTICGYKNDMEGIAA